MLDIAHAPIFRHNKGVSDDSTEDIHGIGHRRSGWRGAQRHWHRKSRRKVLVTGRDAGSGQRREQPSRGVRYPDIIFVQGDISSIRGIDQLVADVSAHTNTLDVLVNNAGYFGDTARQSNDQIEMHFAVNCHRGGSLARCCPYFGRPQVRA